MPHRDEINARAAALLRAPNTPEFYYGVDLLRSALANGGVAVYVSEVRDCSVGLLAATSSPDMQAGIAALAKMLGAPVDMDAHHRRIEIMQQQRYSLDIPQRVVLIAPSGGDALP